VTFDEALHLPRWAAVLAAVALIVALLALLRSTAG
jgi:hypothetical protein